ncbi:UDP-glycosyltransferase 73B4 [Hibiscus syriacus]|uniref:Glycosyltransferase n=1 Tax=Hibiscus syriacus TaxID=106335 RepID=A0A6A3A2T9_HIBSY|nr:scopoletin glucosyltransferase-like [Hibiscus syriacus]KAE8698604.1 UDP-glycosyltransferase 73B4 [Hibiscus syriacus]
MGREIHMFFFPYFAHGHVIPTVDMAKLFASRGVKTTIVTTPVNASFFSNTIQRSRESGIHIAVELLKFPAADVGLPEGCESTDLLPTSPDENFETMMKFMQAVQLLQEPFEKLLREFKPDCLVADLFFPWATDAANKFGIPRLVFQGTSYISLCVMECMRIYEPHKKVQSDSEPFVVPNLPGDIKLTKSQLPDFLKQDVETDFSKIVKANREAELKSYGVVVNSFYELEAPYADYFRNVLGKKAWHIGPLSLCNRENIDKAERGKKSAIDEHECLKWLDSKEPNSVLYICFGSMTCFTSAQLKEIAMALEASELQFIWVVRKQKNNEEDDDWLPEGFEKRREGKGLIIRGWAPQVFILDHVAIGGFVTHCGWNSTLESVCAGVPMVTWPTFAEQFYNEKLVTQVLKIGVAVGAQKWARVVGDFVKMEAIERAVKELMKGDKADEMRNRAKALAEAAKKAIEKGGSSHSDLNALIEEIGLRSQ